MIYEHGLGYSISEMVDLFSEHIFFFFWKSKHIGLLYTEVCILGVILVEYAASWLKVKETGEKTSGNLELCQLQDCNFTNCIGCKHTLQTCRGLLWDCNYQFAISEISTFLGLYLSML